MQRKYGFLGFLSLVGVIGLVTKSPQYYPFLGFAIFFEYFFTKADEMFVENIRKAAAWAFFANLLVTTIVTCYCAMVLGKTDTALEKGIGLGFGIAILLFCFMTAYFDWKDGRGISDD